MLVSICQRSSCLNRHGGEFGVEPLYRATLLYIRLSFLLYLFKQIVRTRREANLYQITIEIISKNKTSNFRLLTSNFFKYSSLQKGGVPAAPSGTATLLRLSPNYQFRPRPLLTVTDFRRPRLSWLDGRCVQGPGTYSPRHG